MVCMYAFNRIIFPTELELKKENNSNSRASFLIFTFTLKMENSILNYLTSKITLPSSL